MSKNNRTILNENKYYSSFKADNLWTAKMIVIEIEHQDKN